MQTDNLRYIEERFGINAMFAVTGILSHERIQREAREFLGQIDYLRNQRTEWLKYQLEQNAQVYGMTLGDYVCARASMSYGEWYAFATC